jgi:penicillin-binding protein 1A
MAAPDERLEGADKPPRRSLLLRIAGGLVLLLSVVVLVPFLLVTLATALAFKNLPSIDTLTDYRPKIPLRIYTADNVLIGEFGEERRNVVQIADVPLLMKQAILAAEDDRFYQHGGIDYEGVMRATLSNAMHGTVFGSGRRQGASTITQQVARNFFLSSEQSYTRKFYEALMAFKIEQTLSKDQILEVYINQIYLGQRAYGFGSAEQVYFGKSLKDIDPAEAAMLAGIPKAPSAYNPVVNPTRAKARQMYVLGRMLALGFITEDQYKKAVDERIVIKTEGAEFAVHAEYVSEMARQIAYDQFKEETYTKGLNVYTTVDSKIQAAAYRSLRDGIMEYERRQKYDGPEAFVDLPDATGDELDQAIEEALLEYTDSDDILAAVVLDASPKVVHAARQGEVFEITGDGLKMCASGLADKAPPAKKIRRGAIIRILKNAKGQWEITEMPQVQAALVTGDVKNGAILALVGGFDFNRNKFNHVTQAWRQPGSSFKPFLYSAALEKGFTPSTIVMDEPITIDAAQTGSQAWEPKNFENKYDGPMTLRKALAASKNMVSIRILMAITPKYVQNYIARFGLDPERHPAYLTMALGAGSVTAWQMLGGYSVFANGGYKINPYFIDRITDNTGQVVAKANVLHAGDEANRVIDARNAFTMNSLLHTNTVYGTAAGARRALKREDLGGKTGTTNDSHDAWFDGYSNDNFASIAWVGFDQPRSLGDRETGGGLALPLWVGVMQVALRGVPEIERPMPPGMVTVNGEVYYTENQPGQGIPPVTADLPPDLAPDGSTPANAQPAANGTTPSYGSVSGTPPPPPSGIPAGALAPALPASSGSPTPYGTLRN